MLKLRVNTKAEWLTVVENDMDFFLRDHAHNERKVAQAALTLASHHPNHPGLVEAMTDLAREELSHFKQVHGLLVERGLELGYDEPDPYMTQLHREIRRKHSQDYLLDRLILFGIVEARGCERFRILGTSLKDEGLRAFYASLAKAEARHHALFIRLAKISFPSDVISERLDSILTREAELICSLPLRAALH